MLPTHIAQNTQLHTKPVMAVDAMSLSVFARSAMLHASAFPEELFRERVAQIIEKLRTLLDVTRQPQLAAEIPHQYADKFPLTEQLVSSCALALRNALEPVGVTDKHFAQMREWVAAKRSVSLRCNRNAECKFLRKDVRDVQSDTKLVTESALGRRESYSLTTVTEYIWQLDVTWELLFYAANAADGVLIIQRSASTELKTSCDKSPKPQRTVADGLDVNITWLLDEKTLSGNFKIDRSSPHCRTPRRNPEIDLYLTFAKSLSEWADGVARTIAADDSDAQVSTDRGMFVPIAPLFESRDSGVVLTSDTVTSMLAEQKRSIAERLAELAKVFPANTGRLISHAEAQTIALMRHIESILSLTSVGVNYVENMLRRQLITAIGKEITAVDFAQYQRFHNRQFFKSEFQPRPFSYAIRRPNHHPEGLLRIECDMQDGVLADPIETFVQHSSASTPMNFALDASAQVSFHGDRYVHAFIQHRFSNATHAQLSLVARARQFSSFILLVGNITSANTLAPKYAVIISNKDEYKIPLNLETIPTAKEFRDAIESLSPEMQRFAKGYRSHQMESTLFGICVIQIKPQLERLLYLDTGSLTKEIDLTQEILKLFLEAQIPPDLISYTGPSNVPSEVKVANVREHVTRVQDQIKKINDEFTKLDEWHRAYTEAEISKVVESKLRQLADMEQKLKEREERMSKLDAMFEKLAQLDKLDSLFMKLNSISIAGGSLERRDPFYPAQRLDYAAPPLSKSTSIITTLRLADTTAANAVIHSLKSASMPTGGDGGRVALIDAAKALAPASAVEKAKQQFNPSLSRAYNPKDYTQLPYQLERKFEESGYESAVRPTIISAGNIWQKRWLPSLLAQPESGKVHTDEQGKERNKAFDLLDALTRSGDLPIVDCAELHVVIAATHCFDKSLIDTVIQDNINPIEKVERSSLIVASSIQQRPPAELIVEDS